MFPTSDDKTASSPMDVHMDSMDRKGAIPCRPTPSACRSGFIVAACNETATPSSVVTMASVAPSSPLELDGMTRRSGNFPPSEWDYRRILSPVNDALGVSMNNVEYEGLKREIKRILKVPMTPLEKLELVDCLQRLGIRYHFEKEIQNMLESIFIETTNALSNVVDMYSTALLFKVLRENGYEVSQDIFKKFLCPEVDFTGFSKDHGYDIRGILFLYEATFLGFEGEHILEMARLFSYKVLKQHLESQNMEPKLEEQVRCILRIPTFWRLIRLHAQWSLSFNDRSATMNTIFLRFAQLDYNLVQELHKQEVKELTKWWRDLSLKDELQFARDRIIESYIWTMGVIFQPQYEDARKYLTKATSLLTVIDDMYDVYGSISELELFTKAIERWDVNAIDKLPQYMQICFLALFNMVNESTYYILKEKDVNVTSYIKKLWEHLCKSYLVEARWYHDKDKPTLEEYIKNGTMSSGVPLAVSYAYIFTSQNISKEVLDSLQMTPNLVNLCGKIFRLNNDMGTSVKELERGDVVKAVECYQQNKNISKSEAQLHIQSIVMDTWKKINKEILSTPLPKDVVDSCINICRASHTFYQKGDGYGSPSKDHVISLLFDRV